MVKSKSRAYTKRQHIQKVKGRRFTDEIRNLDLEKVLVAPIDGGKNSHKALVANYFGDILHDPFEFTNSATGVKMLHTILKSISSSIKAEKVIIGLESTGHYYENLYRSLIDLGYDVAMINPMSVYCQRSGQLNWCKTDEIDLCAIEQVLIDNQATESRLPEGLYYNLKQLTRLRQDEVRKRARLKIQTRVLCDHIFPGLQNSIIFSDFWGKSTILLLENYPTPSSIIRLGAKRLARFFKKHNTKLGLRTAERLANLAKNSLGANRVDLEAHLINLRFKVADLKTSNEKIRKLHIELARYLVQTPGILLLSIKKINVPSAAEYLAEVGPLGQAGSAKKIIARAGLNPSRFQTSEYERSDNPITKHGSNPLRNICLIISQNLIGVDPHSLRPHNPYFREFFDRLVEEGKDKRLAKVACANKFVRVSWAMMQGRELFSPPTRRKNNPGDDPLVKLKRFLSLNKAQELSEELVQTAKERLLSHCCKSSLEKTCSEKVS
jgi:transposase